MFLATAPAGAVQFRVLGWDADDYSLRFDQGHSTTGVQVETDRLSPVYDAPGAQAVSLYRTIETESGEPGRQIACRIVVPPELKRGIVVLIPSTPVSSWITLPAGGQGATAMRVPLTYEYLWLDDSAEARPVGTIEFRNMQRHPVALRIGGGEVRLPPQGKAQIPLVPEAKRQKFRAAALIEGNWRMFASTSLPTRGAGRLMVIFRETSDPSRAGPDDPGIRMVRLYEPPPPAPPPEAP